MSVYNPNENLNKNKEEFKFTKYGEKHISNIKWTYDFTFLKRAAIFFLSACIVGSAIGLIIENIQKKEKQKYIVSEAKEVNTRYLEKTLEKVKQETIAAENLKRAAKEKKTERIEPVKQKQRTGPKVYTWTNEKGQTVHSNQPPK
ncbi:MAG: hypothetical protein PHI97_24290 [Desulfobulbus sp.]|nr:hypothetical protein [Desulfobulbus sp.]